MAKTMTAAIVRKLKTAGSMLRTTMDISARAISLPDRPGVGHLGHQCSQSPGRPLSISPSPLVDLGGFLCR
jgi:hypothetical protein